MSTTDALLVAMLVLILILGYFQIDQQQKWRYGGKRTVYLVGMKDGRIVRYEVETRDDEDLIHLDRSEPLDDLDNMTD